MKVTYSEDKKTAFFNEYKFRRDMKTGYYLATKPTYNGKRERLHCYVWRYFNGPVKNGYHVHHKDENKEHNDIENLVCIRGKTHSKYHLLKYATNHQAEMLENLKKYAILKASEWHRSEEGRKWHSQQGKRTTSELKRKEFVCENCGAHFWKKPLGQNKFCSNNCKSAARRKSGVDDETRICVCCGKEFRANKYTNRKFCSDKCRNSVRRNKGNPESGKTASIQHGS